MSMQSAWTGPPAQARYALTGWDTLPIFASLTRFARTQGLIEYYVNTSKLKCCKEVGHLQSAVSQLTNYLVGHLKSVILKLCGWYPKENDVDRIWAYIYLADHSDS